MTGAASFSTHGGILHREMAALGISPEAVIDFSVNVNPYGPCAEIRSAVNAAPIDRYPDPTATPAREAIARWLDVSKASVIVGSGAVDILWTLARAVLRPGDTVLIAEPAFSEMRMAALRVGARVVEHRARAEDDFAFAPDGFAAALEHGRPRVASVAVPANPSGALAPVDAIARLADEYTDTQFVVDVSFLSLSSRPDDRILRLSDRILWVRSLTKELSVPGIRIGFAVGPPSLVARLHEERPPWSVSAPAQAAAVAATTNEVRRFVEATRLMLLRDGARTAARLSELGLRACPSETAYMLVELGPARSATDLRRALLARRKMLVRDASSFGLPHHLRIAARPAADTDLLISALQEELGR